MKTLSVLALVALIAGCHFDKLFSGGGDTPLSHDPPAGLAFTSGPGNARAGQPLGPVRVAVVDSAGRPVAGADSLVTVALGASPSGDAKLSGTDTAHAVNGVARFATLSIDKPGTGYTLTATVAGLPSKESPSFNVTPLPPTTGSITVATATTGPSPDLDGYTIAADAGASQPMGVHDSVTFSGLPAGSHSVTLGGVAGNCTVSGALSRDVTVTGGDTTRVAYSVTCPTPPATTGSVRVTTSTTGASPDVDGYSVAVDNGTSQHIDPNNSTGVIFTDLPVGNHTAVLSDVAGNCTVTGGTSKTVNVTAGNTATASFAVDCPTPPPPPNQQPVVTAGPNQNEITGLLVSLRGASFSDPDHDGPWNVTIDWGDGSTTGPFPMSSEG